MPLHGQLGELAETTPLLRVRARKGTESSNLSLSAISYYFNSHGIFYLENDRTESAFLTIKGKLPSGIRQGQSK